MRQLAEVFLKEKDRKAIQETVLRLRKKFPVAEVRLFGSKARGDDDNESDIDLLIMTTSQINWRERDAMTEALFDIQLKYGVVFNLLVVSQQEWALGRTSVHPIHDEIEQQGIAA